MNVSVGARALLTALLLTVWLLHPGFVLARPEPGGQSGRAPLALHPLEPPSPFALDSLTWHFDFVGMHHGSVPIRLHARLSNPDGEPRASKLMLVTADNDAQVSQKGLGTDLERLVVPYPSEDDPQKMMVPVCLFRVILMPFQSTTLDCDIHQSPAWTSPDSLVETLRLPDRPLWRRCPKTEIDFELPPHLQLVVKNRSETLSASNSRVVAQGRHVSYQLDTFEPKDLRFDLQWVGPGPIRVLAGSALLGPLLALLLVGCKPPRKRLTGATVAGFLALGVNWAWFSGGQAQRWLDFLYASATWNRWLWWMALVVAPVLTLVCAAVVWPGRPRGLAVEARGHG
jgi:hypothetical protein